MPTEMTTLYYKDSGSDKVYQASIDPASNGLFLVNFAFGRRGATLQTGLKTASPVDFAAAKKIYDKLLSEKKAKGYQVGADGSPTSHVQTTTATQVPTGNLPQLLNAIDEAELERLIKDDSFWMQQKHDGKRIMIEKTKFSVVATNRKGLSCGFSSAIKNDAADISVFRDVENFILDGEMIGDKYYVFDLLQLGFKDLRDLPYNQRYEKLVKLIPTTANFSIIVVATAKDERLKRSLFHNLKTAKLEGVVLKKSDAPYRPGRPASGGNQLKFKFVETCSCVVMDKPTGKAQSVWLQMLNACGKWEAVGKCTIPSNFSVPIPGKIVEIRYLYAYPNGGSLYQPVFLGERDDLDATACVMTQLKYKPEDTDEEES
jgi:bifunctional non-homologous end joining protein LigD